MERYAGYTAVFGGSFDPPHIGHQTVLLYLTEVLAVDEVWLMPTYEHPLGKRLTPFRHRIAMAEAMAEGVRRCHVRDTERDLAEEGSGGRTLPLLEALAQRFAARRFTFVVGSDILQERNAWHRWEELSRRFPPIVIERAGHPSSDDGSPAFMPPEISSRALREGLQSREPWCEKLIPATVYQYIEENGLFRDGYSA